MDIKSESSSLHLVREQIKVIGKHCELDEREIFDVQVAVGEAAANAIEHGSPGGPENTVHISVSCDGELLVITVKDEGKFIRRMPAPDIEVDFRGRGIPLMLALMDRVTIDEAKDGTQVILTKKVNDNGRGEQAV